LFHRNQLVCFRFRHPLARDPHVQILGPGES
jgi:hypothetical protein